TRIELAFEHVLDDRLTQYKIVRYWEKQDAKDTLGILVYDGHNEWWPDQAIASTWDEYIETLLPLGISNLFLFDGEQVKELAEMETPPDFVIAAIKSLLGLELAERLAADLDIFAGRKRKELAGAKDKTTLDKIEETFLKLVAEKEAANNEIASSQNEVDQADKELKKASDRFLSEGGKIAGERSRLDQQLNDHQKQAETLRQSMVELAASSLPLALISPLLEQAKTQAETETHQQQAKIAKEAIQQRSDRLLNYLTQLSLKPKQLQEIKTFIEQEDANFNQLAENGEPWLEASEASITYLEALLRYEIQANQNAVSEKIKALKLTESEIDFVERQLDKAASPEAYEKLATAVRHAQNQVAKAQATNESALRKLSEIERKIAQSQKELEEFSHDYLKNRNNQHILNSIGQVQTTLKLFKEKLTLKKLNKLEVEITECFRYLLHKSDLVHRVVIDTETFALSIYDSQGKAVPKHRLSAGEKQLLAIAFLWGLARVSGRHLPIAIDTPLGRLDSSHRNNLIEKYFPSASHQVILLSTDTEIAQTEYKHLKELNAIAHTYLLKYDASQQQTIIEANRYFWD
ncbi:MAG: DNA sulfur modification protein DndD, partial [Actinomycetota bacterium]